MVFEPTILSSKSKPVHYLQFTWRGEIYKDMDVKVDLVPMITFKSDKFELVESLHEFSHCSEDLILKAIHNTYCLPTAFSIFDSTMIKALPEEIKQGYILAKALRRGNLFHTRADKLLDLDIYDIEEHLTTFMLKMAVLWLAYGAPFDMFREKAIKMTCTPYEWAIFVLKLTFCFINTSGYANSLKLRFKDPGRYNCNHCYAPFTCVHPRNIPDNERAAC